MQGAIMHFGHYDRKSAYGERLDMGTSANYEAEYRNGMVLEPDNVERQKGKEGKGSWFGKEEKGR